MNTPQSNVPAATSPNKPNPMLLGIDRIVDFATLGEYRVVTGAAPKQVQESDIWAVDIEWDVSVSTAARIRPTCSLPRARDRRLARERVSG